MNPTKVIFSTACWQAVLALAALSCGACAPPIVDLYNPSVQPPVTPAAVYDDRPFAEILRDNVKGGLVDYAHLADHAAPLERFLTHIRDVGPKQTPNFFKDPLARLAYYLNAYNACVLKAVLSENVPATMYDFQRRRLEYEYRFMVDGSVVTLTDIRVWARKASRNDARIEFAMCGAALGCPPLSAQPFRAYNLHERLQRLAQEAMDNAQMVRVDHGQRLLLIATTIWDQREVFEALYRRETGSESATMLNCLMQMASGIRRQYLSRATGYDVRLLPFDRALNTWTPE